MVVLAATVKWDPVLIWRVMSWWQMLMASTVESLLLCNLHVLQNILLEPLEKQCFCVKDFFSN